MPVCPKCEKLISESHYERHLSRCGTTHGDEHEPLHVHSATGQVGSTERGGPPTEDHGGINWRKVGAAFLIFLLIGSVAVFFVLYALSLL